MRDGETGLTDRPEQSETDNAREQGKGKKNSKKHNIRHKTQREMEHQRIMDR